MRTNVCALLIAVLPCLVAPAVGQDGTCEDFELGSPECVAPCTGKPQIDNMTVGYIGSGNYHIEYETFTCSSSAPNNCKQTTQVPTAQINSLCGDGGGGGDGGCGDDKCYCDDGSCGADCCTEIRRRDSGAAERARWSERKLQLELLDMPVLRSPAVKPEENRHTSQNNQ